MPKQSGDGKDVAGVLAPPPLIYLGFLLLGLGLSWLWPLTIGGGLGLRVGAGVALLAAGGIVGNAGFRRLGKAGTNVRPDRPTTALVTGGIYRYTRNPLYVALAFVYTGIALLCDSLWALALLVPMLLVIRHGVIAREEAYLERKFGDDYRQFKTTVRRWL